MLWHKTIGKGPNLVLLHGWGFSSDIFQKLIEKYKKQAVFVRLKKKGLRQMTKLGF